MTDFDKLFDAMYAAFMNIADSSMWTKKAAVEVVLDAIAANTPECHCHESRRVKIMASSMAEDFARRVALQALQESKDQGAWFELPEVDSIIHELRDLR